MCYNSPKRMSLNTFRSELPRIYTRTFSTLHTSLLYMGKPPKITQNWTALTLGHREAGISLYYHIQMPLVEPRKWENGYTFQSVDWTDCGNAALVAFQDSCQLLRKSMSALVSQAEIYRHAPVRFGLLRRFKQNKTKKVFLEQQVNTSAARNTNSSLPSL